MEILYMQLRDKLLKEIKRLSVRELTEVYSLVLALRSKQSIDKDSNHSQGYLRARKALKNYKGKLSDEIIAEREDRL